MKNQDGSPKTPGSAFLLTQIGAHAAQRFAERTAGLRGHRGGILGRVKDLGQLLVVVVVRPLLGPGGRRGLRPGAVAQVGVQSLAVVEDFDVSATANRAFARASNRCR
jgi:hypothetical protein